MRAPGSVIEGQIAVFIGDERFTAAARDFVLGPRGIPHIELVGPPLSV